MTLSELDRSPVRDLVPYPVTSNCERLGLFALDFFSFDLGFNCGCVGVDVILGTKES